MIYIWNQIGVFAAHHRCVSRKVNQKSKPIECDFRLGSGLGDGYGTLPVCVFDVWLCCSDHNVECCRRRSFHIFVCAHSWPHSLTQHITHTHTAMKRHTDRQSLVVIATSKAALNFTTINVAMLVDSTNNNNPSIHCHLQTIESLSNNVTIYLVNIYCCCFCPFGSTRECTLKHRILV